MADPTESKGIPGKVRFFYIKNSHFRAIHVDGALGGITPRGFIHFAIYSERPAIPQMAEHEVSDGQLGAPVIQEGKSGIVRELDADLIMTKQTAAELRNWLSDRIADLDRLEQERATPPKTRKRRGRQNAI